MRVGIIDADMIIRNNKRSKDNSPETLFDKEGHLNRDKTSTHRFPNLCCMKISGYHKDLGNEVKLLLDYSNLEDYDKVYLSKVFTDTPVPEWVLKLTNVTYGGTGFFFDKAPALPCEIEHHMPDYHLYDEWVAMQIAQGKREADLKEYTEYSIGYLTRGCFRKCPFCVNQKYDRVELNSALSEFYDPSRPKICLLDDNFLGHPQWREMLDELKATGKPFKFKQGLDERLLTDEKMEALLSCRYDNDITFAFDRIQDYDMIERKLQLVRRHTHKAYQFYLLVGFDEEGKYDDEFWYSDIVNAFQRMELLMNYGCYPYVMRFKECENSPYSGMYTNLARYCNLPVCRPVKKLSFRQWLHHPDNVDSSPMRYYEKFIGEHPEFVTEHENYLDMTFTKRGGYVPKEPSYIQLNLFDSLAVFS